MMPYTYMYMWWWCWPFPFFKRMLHMIILLSPRNSGNSVGGDIVTQPFVGGWVSECVQTTVFVQSLSNFTYRLWKMRKEALLILCHGVICQGQFCPPARGCHALRCLVKNCIQKNLGCNFENLPANSILAIDSLPQILLSHLLTVFYLKLLTEMLTEIKADTIRYRSCDLEHIDSSQLYNGIRLKLQHHRVNQWPSNLHCVLNKITKTISERELFP